jgi:hypothetical protein
MGLPAALWLDARGACAQARAEGWRAQSHIRPLPDMPGDFWASASDIFPPPGQPAPVPAAAAQILAEAEAICAPIVWILTGPMTVLSPKPFRAAAWS